MSLTASLIFLLCTNMKTQSSVPNVVALHSGSTIQPTSTSTSADPNGVDLFDQLQNILIGDSDESTKEAAQKSISMRSTGPQASSLTSGRDRNKPPT